MATFLFLVFVVVLMWVVMAAPIGLRRLTRRFVVEADYDHVWSALHPFGDNIAWNEAVSLVHKNSDHSGRMITTHMDRAGGFIEREFELSDYPDKTGWGMRFTSDTSLAQDFWSDHTMHTQLRALSHDRTEIMVSETDRYNGIAFLLFRFFSMRRTEIKFKIWAREATFKKGGLFEKPSTQIAMALLSAFLLWPAFGLTQQGFMLSVALTVVVGLHELGHILAFRLMGHKHARMIFIPILGGIAMGGRPYDKHFEIGFSALMGAGFSAFFFAAIMFMQPYVQGPWANSVLIFALIGALFNLGNLIPVWKFDGGQVLRQIFKSSTGQALGAFIVLGALLAVGHTIGVPASYLLAVGVVFSILSLMTSKKGVKPKNPLTPMVNMERVAMSAAFGAVVTIHCAVLIWSVDRIFV